MAVKEKSGLIRGLNKGHVSAPPSLFHRIERLEEATVRKDGRKVKSGDFLRPKGGIADIRDV